MTLGTGDYITAGNAIDPRPILIVTGLVQEARIAAGPGMAVICSSSSPTQLRALLTVVDPETIRGVISFGVAGGLDPTLRSGDVVLATEVLSGDTRWAAGLSLGDDLIERLTSGRRRVVRGSLAGAEEVVTKRSCKAASISAGRGRGASCGACSDDKSEGAFIADSLARAQGPQPL